MTIDLQPTDRLAGAAHGQGHGGVVTPTTEASVGRLRFDVDEMRRQIRQKERPEPPLDTFQIPASLPGAVVVSESAEGMTHRDSTAVHFHLHLRTAGSSTTTVVLFVDGSSVLSRNMTSGVTDVDEDIAVGFTQWQTRFYWAVTAAGAGAEDLTATLQFE